MILAGRSLRVVTDLTEREIDRDPARLLQASSSARRAHWGVALDDVGAVPHSLALLPFVQPDVVKLDMSLLRSLGRADTAAVANAVRAYSEATGATILAEGIEDEADALAARVLGASYGQGWLFGRPGALPERVAAPDEPFAFDQVVDPDAGRTPFEIAARARPVGRATKELPLQMSLHLEHQALVGGESLVLLSSFQEAQNFTPGTAARYAGLAGRNVLSVTMAAGMGDVVGAGAPHGTTMTRVGGAGGVGESSPGGVRGEALRSVNLAGDDPLVAEWNVVVVGPHFAGALIARDCGDRGPDQDRRFDYVLTHDRDLVVRAARIDDEADHRAVNSQGR